MTDKSLVDQIKHYQRDIVKCPDNRERMLRCIERLHVLPVTIEHLQETGVGRSVNELRKCGGEVGAAAGALVCKWKSMVKDEEEGEDDDSAVESECEESKCKSTNHILLNDEHKKREHFEHLSKSSLKSSRKENEHTHRSSMKESENIREIKLSSSSKHKTLGKSDEKVPIEKRSTYKESSVVVKNSSHSLKNDLDSSKYKKNHSSHTNDLKNNGVHQNDKLISAHKSSSSSSSTRRLESKTKDETIKIPHDKRKNSHSIKEDIKKKDVYSHKLDIKNNDTELSNFLSESKDNDHLERKHKMSSSTSKSRSSDDIERTDKSKHMKHKYLDSRSKGNTLSRSQGKSQGVVSSKADEKINDRTDYKKHHDKSKANKDDRYDEELSDKLDTKRKSSQKYTVKTSDSDSSDGDLYKPRRKRKRSTSTEQESAKKKVTGKAYKPGKKRDYSSEESEPDSSRDYDSVGDRYANSDKIQSHNVSDSDQGARSDVEEDQSCESDVETNRSLVGSTGHEDSNDSRSESNNSDEADNDSNSEIYLKREIKKERESPPRTFQCENPKTNENTSNYSTSSSKSHNTHRATKKELDYESLKIKKEKSDKNKVHFQKSENENKSKHRRSSSNIPRKEDKSTDKKAKVKIERAEDGSIDCESGASFADALLGLGDSSKKTLKKKLGTSPRERSPKQVSRSVKDRGSSKANSSRSSSSSSTAKSSFNKEIDLLSHNIKLEPLDVDLSVTLPEITPNYRPQPHYSPPDSPAKRLKVSDDNALASIMSSKNQRTKVYSGNKSSYQEVPSLFELCTQVLRENIDGLEYTGGVPYDLLKPVLDRATAIQLYNLEDYNPYLVEDTDGLWKFHCSRDFRGKKPEEFETWRELYWRCFDAREKKLQELSANINQSKEQSITNQRKTKLAYIDSVVKPPRNVARNQMKFGTGRAVKHDLVSKAMVGATSTSSAAEAPVRVPPSSRPHLATQPFPIPNFLKKKKAPLMAKTLQLMKGHRFKR